MNARECDITFIGFVTGNGGDAHQMAALAAALVATGPTVGIVVPAVADSEMLERRCLAAGVALERTELIVNTAHGSRQRLDHSVRLLRSVQSPLVHFHTGYSCLPTMVMAGLVVMRYRRTFVTVHGGFHALVPRSAKARMWAATARRQFHAVVSPSDHGRRFQISLGVPADRAITIHNGVQPMPRTSPDPDLARQFGLDPDAPLIVFTSRVDPGKGTSEAVRILAGVRSQFPDAQLLFVGTGSQEAEVRAEADRLGVGSHVTLLGFRTDVVEWLALATVWLLPTEVENFSLALLEALAAGCAVVSTMCRGNDEVLVDEVNSLTFPVGDVAAGTAAIVRLIDDRALRDRLRAGALATADRFTHEAMVQRYLACYEAAGALVGGPPVRGPA